MKKIFIPSESAWLTELKYKAGEDPMSEALRPCPCCGGESKLIKGHFCREMSELFLGYFVNCMNPECGVHTTYFGVAWDAVDVWNMRTHFTEAAIFHESVTPDPEETFLLVPHCPLCGGAAYIRTPSFGWIGEVGKFSVSCNNCKFMTREHDELLYAVEEWNRRTNNNVLSL